jgi:type IV secretion system protein VirB10
MPVREIGDPRLAALFGANDPREAGVRPTVRLPRQAVSTVVIAAIALLLALALFTVLNSRRTHQVEPSVGPGAADGASSAWAPPPPLYVPPAPQPIYVAPPAEQKPASILVPPAPVPAQRVAIAAPAPNPPPIVGMLSSQVGPTTPAQRSSTGSSLVIDTGGGSSSPVPLQLGAARSPGEGSARTVVRMRASVFANRSMTVPQGYLIPVVLETAFDSTRPGYARAIVSRDVRGFDGKYILIPRGSRLIGDYKSVVAQGQNRAIISWTRLIRPDGMTIGLDAPAVDPVGRGGVAASVNTHFFAKLGNALLQSTVALGQALAGRAAIGPVVVLQGGANNAAAQIAPPATDYTPTLKVRPGKSISVFVAQDLDFSAAGEAR